MTIKREKREKVRLGYIGVGDRGYRLLNECFTEMADVEVRWICELNDEKLERALKLFSDKGKPMPRVTKNYHEMLADPELDAVAVMTGWNSHMQCTLDSVKAGKYTAMEVGCAYDISECYELIAAHEKTGAPLMMLENCCYRRRAMTALKMIREGIFGEIVHCTGGYSHFLCEKDMFKSTDDGVDINHYRQYEYLYRNAETYPTHELGPLAKLLRINRGNRFMTLASFSSKSAGVSEYLKNHVPKDYPLQGKRFKQGDIVTTVITCAGGETIRLTLDTTLPRPYYSNELSIRGTRGCCIEEGFRFTFYLDGMEEGVFGNEEEYLSKNEHPLYKEYLKVGYRAGWDGINWLVTRAFIEAVKNGTDTPIDAYDTVTWMAVGPLSEQSIAMGGRPVSFPDFTRGKWFRREPVLCKYCLDEVCEDLDTPIVPEE